MVLRRVENSYQARSNIITVDVQLAIRVVFSPFNTDIWVKTKTHWEWDDHYRSSGLVLCTILDDLQAYNI